MDKKKSTGFGLAVGGALLIAYTGDRGGGEPSTELERAQAALPVQSDTYTLGRGEGVEHALNACVADVGQRAIAREIIVPQYEYVDLDAGDKVTIQIEGVNANCPILPDYTG